ncbi:MAG: hypothetical protein HUK40_04365 [Desulfobacter sp.]|nr:hypothetical protein [Desulfobacter sp.]
MEMDKAAEVPPQPDAPSELEKAVGYYFKGKNAEAAVPIFTKLAEQNNPDAHYYLGLIYIDNELQYHDIERGISHLSAAVHLGHSQAMHHIGVIYKGVQNSVSVE